MKTSQNSDFINSTKYLYAILGVAFCGFFIYSLYPLLVVDFWYDEVLSLEEFILVPLQKTVTDYSVPNNHIFFSLLMNIWLKLWGIETFAQAANTVFIVRSLSLIFAAITMLFVYKTGSLLDKLTGLIALLALLSTIPFYNFAVQIRGYGLSIMLCSMLLFYALRFYNEPIKKWGIAVTILTALLLYTIPSNIYTVLSALVVLGVIFLRQCNNYHFRIALRFNAIKLMGCLLLGIGFGVVLFLPVGSQVVNNEYVKSEGLFRWGIWGEAATFYYYMFFNKGWMLPLILPSIFLFVKDEKVKSWTLVFAALLILPFIISFVRGGTPFNRTFLWVIPIFSVALGQLIAPVFEIKILRKYKQILVVAIVLLVSMNTTFQISTIFNKTKFNLSDEVKSQNIYYNYYLGNYHPNRNLRNFKEQYYQKGTQVFLHEVDKYAMHGYLPIHNIKWQPYTGTIPTLNKYYIITAFEKQAIETFKQYDTTFEFRNISGKKDFVTIIEAKKRY